MEVGFVQNGGKWFVDSGAQLGHTQPGRMRRRDIKEGKSCEEQKE